MSITRRVFEKLKKLLFKKPRISWNRIDEHNIIWKLPNETYPNTDNFGEIEVKQGQRVAVYKTGVFLATLPPGINKVENDFDSAYFIDVTPKKFPIGIRAPNYPITKDKMSFGFSGSIIFRIMEDPTSIGNFLTKIVANQDEVTTRYISLWLRDGLLFQVFKEILSDYDYAEFRGLEKMELDMTLETKLGFELKDYGLEVQSFEIRFYTEPKTF
ncbi:MAG: SPFH domain-containing protein [Promethearchaeota archaeon]